MEFASLIGEFGARYGMGNLAPDSHDAVGFAVDGRQVVLKQLEEEPDAAFVLVELCTAPSAGSSIVNRILMNANQSLFILDGMSIVLHPETDRYCLLSRFDVAKLDFVAFDAIIGRVLERAGQWDEFLKKLIPVAVRADEVGAAVETVDDLTLPAGFLRI